MDLKSFPQSLCFSTCFISAQPVALNIYGAVEDQRLWLGVVGWLEASIWRWKAAHIKSPSAAVSTHPGLLQKLIWSWSCSGSKYSGVRTPIYESRALLLPLNSKG